MLASAILFAALAGCDAFRGYEVRVEDPTRDTGPSEVPYYDYQRRETVIPDRDDTRYPR